MDPLTHVLSGVLLGQAVKPRFPRVRGIVPFAAFAAWMPDIDNFIGGDPEAYLRLHRGLTHSWLGGAALGIIVATLFWLLFGRRARLQALAALAVAGVFLHIFLDLVTSFGTQIWLPFSNARASLDAVFIIDPIFTVALLVLALVAAIKSRPKVALAGAALAILYPLSCLGVRCAVEASLDKRLRAEGREFSDLHVSPDAFSPWFWKVVLESDSAYEIAGYRLYQPGRPLEFQAYRKVPRERLRELGESNSLVRTFEWFAVYPVLQKEDAQLLAVSDLRFQSCNPLLAERREIPFVLTITRSERGGVLTATLD